MVHEVLQNLLLGLLCSSQLQTFLRCTKLRLSLSFAPALLVLALPQRMTATLGAQQCSVPAPQSLGLVWIPGKCHLLLIETRLADTFSHPLTLCAG